MVWALVGVGVGGVGGGWGGGWVGGCERDSLVEYISHISLYIHNIYVRILKYLSIYLI